MTPTPTSSQSDSRPLPLLGEAALRDFIGAGAVTRLQAVGRAGGFDLRVHMGATEATLGNARGGVRLFASLEALTALLKRLEHPCFEVDASNYVSGRLRSAAPKDLSTQKPPEKAAEKPAAKSKASSRAGRKHA